jgi:crotonobetainyl-CoA:carnitine CoA-transferase CaiB-like acyl-CoA transferase
MVALIVATERLGPLLRGMTPDLEAHEGATSGPQRAQSMAGWLGEIIAGWFRGQTRAEAAERLLAVGLPVGPVQNAREIYECPHVEARSSSTPDTFSARIRPSDRVQCPATEPSRPAPLSASTTRSPRMLGYSISGWRIAG